MRELARSVYQLKGFPPHAINAYLVDDVLVDAGARLDRRRILHQLRGRRLAAHALTHAHGDHQGASRAVCTTFGIPFWVHADDAAAAEDPQVMRAEMASTWQASASLRLFAGPGHPVDRRLQEGDEVAGFQVLHVPGHSRGHIAFWREEDRVLIAGDVFNTMDPITLRPGLRLPYDFWTPDPGRNRASAKRLGALEPSVVLVGHGPPLRDTRKFVEFCEAL